MSFMNNNEFNNFNEPEEMHFSEPHPAEPSALEPQVYSEASEPVPESHAHNAAPQPAVEESPKAPVNSYMPPTTGSYSSYGGFTPHKDKKKPKNRLALTIVCTALVTALISTVCCTALFSFWGKETTSQGTGNGSSANNATVQKVTIENQVESMVEAVYEKCANSVVGISTSAAVQSFFGGNSTAEMGEGSGVIYSADGYIITNYHVISSAMAYNSYVINVYFPNDPDTGVPATVVGYNVSGDLAVLKVNKTGLPAVEIGSSDDVKVGQYVVAIGCPGGIEFMGSASYGIISGLNRKVTVDEDNTMTLIQTDAAINPGNSGGAMLNSQGQLIGVNSVKFVDESFEGMGFAIPVDTVVEICNNIISKQNDPSPYLGIEISKKYDENILSMLGYPSGAVVLNVDDNSPAAECGLRRGDIITEFAGKEIKDYTTLTSLMNDLEPEQTVKLRFYRAGRYYDTTLTVGANNAQ